MWMCISAGFYSFKQTLATVLLADSIRTFEYPHRVLAFSDPPIGSIENVRIDNLIHELVPPAQVPGQLKSLSLDNDAAHYASLLWTACQKYSASHAELATFLRRPPHWVARPRQ